MHALLGQFKPILSNEFCLIVYPQYTDHKLFYYPSKTAPDDIFFDVEGSRLFVSGTELYLRVSMPLCIKQECLVCVYISLSHCDRYQLTHVYVMVEWNIMIGKHIMIDDGPCIMTLLTLGAYEKAVSFKVNRKHFALTFNQVHVKHLQHLHR